MSLKNYLELNRRLNATEQKFKASCKVIADKFAAVKNGTSCELPTAEEISQSKKAWQELHDIGQAMNRLHWN